jgi:hypothetical protein
MAQLYKPPRIMEMDIYSLYMIIKMQLAIDVMVVFLNKIFFIYVLIKKNPNNLVSMLNIIVFI